MSEHMSAIFGIVGRAANHAEKRLAWSEERIKELRHALLEQARLTAYYNGKGITDNIPDETARHYLTGPALIALDRSNPARPSVRPLDSIVKAECPQTGIEGQRGTHCECWHAGDECCRCHAPKMPEASA